MKKWILILLVALTVILYLSAPTLLQLAGYQTTRVMVYNGTQTPADYTLNGEVLQLAPGEAQVFRSSRFTNQLRHLTDQDEFTATFGPGQHFINLGPARLRLLERFYRWDDVKKEFFPYAIDDPKDRLLYDATLGKGLHTLDNCWDCMLLLPPNERPYRYLTPENKDRRLIVTSRM